MKSIGANIYLIGVANNFLDVIICVCIYRIICQLARVFNNQTSVIHNHPTRSKVWWNKSHIENQVIYVMEVHVISLIFPWFPWNDAFSMIFPWHFSSKMNFPDISLIWQTPCDNMGIIFNYGWIALFIIVFVLNVMI